MVSDKTGSMLGKEDPNKALNFSALTSVGLTMLCLYSYPKVKNKSIISGAILGTGLNSVVKILKTPVIKTKLPEKIQAELQGIDMTPEEFESVLNNEIANRIQAAQMSGSLAMPNTVGGYDNIPITQIDYNQLNGNEQIQPTGKLTFQNY